jgi:hypothetical protein
MGATHGYDKNIRTNPERVEHFPLIYNYEILLFNPVGVFTILYFITTGCTRGYGCSTLSGLVVLFRFFKVIKKQAVLQYFFIFYYCVERTED